MPPRVSARTLARRCLISNLLKGVNFGVSEANDERGGILSPSKEKLLSIIYEQEELINALQNENRKLVELIALQNA